MLNLIPVSWAESVTGFPWITRNNPGLVEFSRGLLMPYERRAVTSDKKKTTQMWVYTVSNTFQQPTNVNMWKASTVVRLLRMTQNTNELDYSKLLTYFFYKSELLKEFVSFQMWLCFKQSHTYVRHIEEHKFNIIWCKSLTWPVRLRSTFVTISAYKRSQKQKHLCDFISSYQDLYRTVIPFSLTHWC